MFRFIVLLAFVVNLNSLSTAKKCKKYEEYEECPNRVCRAKTCNDIGYPLPCYQTDLQNVSCGTPQCICEIGYVKNKNGLCVPARECPSCGGDQNAWYGCGTYCTRCSNYKSKNKACILSCMLNSCDCRPGYVYDEIKKKCVTPEECPCGRNEVRSNCANSPCVTENCSQKGLRVECNQDNIVCKSGCLCAKGYLRNDNGVCIPEKQCPLPPCGPNEIASTCKHGCLSNCAEPNRITYCSYDPARCQPGCVCADGYLRDDKDVCVPKDKCPTN